MLRLPIHRLAAPFALALLVLCLLALCVPAARAIAGPEEVGEYKLDNGLKVLLMENHNAPVVSFYVVYRVGSKYERPGITGISHLLEHMMFKSTDQHGPAAIFDFIQRVGGNNNASTWQDRTIYFETIPASALDEAMGLEADRMRGALMLEEDHHLEMPVVRNELEQDADNPQGILGDEMNANAYEAHPYGIPTIGWVDDVEGITAADLKAYYDRWYQPDNAFIVAVGDFKSDALLAKIKTSFGGIPAGGYKTPRLPQEPVQRGERRFVVKRSGDVDYLSMAWHIPDNRNKDAFALQLLGSILGRGRTSRLYTLVDSGQCSSASAGSGAFNQTDPGLFSADFAISPGVKPEDVEAAAYAEIEKIKQGGVSDEELARAKKQERVNFVFARDSLASEARYLINFETYGGDWRRLYDYLPGLDAVTSDDIKRVASQYLTQDNRTVGLYDAQPGADDSKEHGGPSMPSGGGGMRETAQDWANGADIGDAGQLVTASTSQAAPVAAPAPTMTASGGLVTPQINAESETPYASVYTLSNGVTLVVRESHENSSVNLSGLVRAGSVYDPAERPGMASMAIDMLSRGTTAYSKKQLAQISEDDGIRLGFGAGRETFRIDGRCLSEDLSKMLDLLQAQLLTPTFPADELERLRKQTLAGLLEEDNDTGTRASEAALAAVYGADNPYARRIDGTEDSVKAMTADELKAWYKQYAVPAGAIITVVGDVNAEQLHQELEKRLGAWQGTAPAAAVHTAAHAPDQHEISIELPDKHDVSLLWLGPCGDAASLSLPTRQVANYVFGGGFTTRFMGRLRGKEGLTYGARSGWDDNLIPGIWTASTDVNPTNVDKAVIVAGEELQRYFADGPTADEIRDAKSYLAGSFEVRLASNGPLASALTDAVYRGFGVGYIQQYPGMVQAVSEADIKAAIRAAMDPSKLVLVKCGTLSAATAPAAAP